jgi:cytochrome c-type biogenesis protein
MRASAKAAIVAVVLASVGSVVALKPSGAPGGPAEGPAAPGGAGLPRLLELGGGECVACRAMEPVLEALEAGYAGRLKVERIDTAKDEDAWDRYDLYIIPTQVFFDASGTERWRHEGFIAREDIVAKWRELGVELGEPAAEAKPPAAGVVERLLGRLSRAVAGTPLIALSAALVWGVLSVLLSPCHLSSIPLIVGFIDKQGRATPRRACAIASLFAVGILITIAAVGAATAAAGRMAGDLGPWASYAVAALFLVVGLHLLGVVPLPWSGPGQVGTRRRGLLAAFLLGLAFGVAIGPCTFAYMAPLLGVVFRLGAARAAYGALLLLVYGVGHCAVIVVAGTSMGLVQRYLAWSQQSRGPAVVKAACGALVCLGGLYLIHIA